jgi:type I restriction enzyme S subunit
VSCIGWQLGKAAIIGTEAFCNQQLNVVIPSTGVDSEYLYYQLNTRRDEIRSFGSVGTRTPILKKSAFERITIPLPPLPVQRKLAAILSVYDDLIENNSRRMEILTEMAQVFVGALITLVLLAGALLAAAPKASASMSQCPANSVCVWSGSGWTGTFTSWPASSGGCHNHAGIPSIRSGWNRISNNVSLSSLRVRQLRSPRAAPKHAPC